MLSKNYTSSATDTGSANTTARDYYATGHVMIITDSTFFMLSDSLLHCHPLDFKALSDLAGFSVIYVRYLNFCERQRSMFTSRGQTYACMLFPCGPM